MNATRAVTDIAPALAEYLGMPKLNQFDIAKIIAESVAASLSQAIALGCTQDQVPNIAKAIGGNAGMALYIELLERGVADE